MRPRFLKKKNQALAFRKTRPQIIFSKNPKKWTTETVLTHQIYFDLFQMYNKFGALWTYLPSEGIFSTTSLTKSTQPKKTTPPLGIFSDRQTHLAICPTQPDQAESRGCPVTLGSSADRSTSTVAGGGGANPGVRRKTGQKAQCQRWNLVRGQGRGQSLFTVKS